MRPLIEMDTIQIEITNYCPNQCSNCTRLCGHHEKPYFMDFEYFKKAVDSLIDFPKMVGMMGGEPLYHPQFKEMCKYMASKISPERLGLWTCFPEGKEDYRNVITETFGNIFLNDHSRSDVLHGPILVESENLSISESDRWLLINDCWVQKYWSASINPRGAFFCEVAASLSMVMDKPDLSCAWEVQPGWWKKIPKDYKEQMEKYCVKCGCAMPLKKRYSIEEKDDISQAWFDKLKEKSPKLKRKQFEIHDKALVRDERTPATYKDEDYRAKIADKYGIFLILNERRFNTPHLKSEWSK